MELGTSTSVRNCWIEREHNRFKMADGLEEIDALKKNWKTDELRRFLKEREMNCGANKEELAKKVFWATKLDIKPAPTKAEELLEIKKSREAKLMVDNGIKLPFPEELKSCWETDNWLLFPQTSEEEVEEFLKGVFKAQDKGAGLLISNHLSNVKSHVMIMSDIAWWLLIVHQRRGCTMRRTMCGCAYTRTRERLFQRSVPVLQGGSY